MATGLASVCASRSLHMEGSHVALGSEVCLARMNFTLWLPSWCKGESWQETRGRRRDRGTSGSWLFSLGGFPWVAVSQLLSLLLSRWFSWACDSELSPQRNLPQTPGPSSHRTAQASRYCEGSAPWLTAYHQLYPFSAQGGAEARGQDHLLIRANGAAPLEI